jgi:hypothetical protein
MLLHAWQTRRVDRAFMGRPGGAAAQGMRRHLAGCERCRRRYERHLLAEAALPDGDARAEERLWREIARVASEPLRPRRTWLVPLVLAAAAFVLVPFLLVRQEREAPVARGGSGPVLAPSLHVFRAVSGGTPEPAGTSIRGSDGLLFAYSNPGTAYSHLMVFALDEQQRVYWYYPAYEQAGQDPEAVAIASARAGVELAEVIHHPLPPGQVRLFALFLPRAEHVLAVESAVTAAYGAGRAPLAQEVTLDVPGSRQESRLFEVQP